MSFERFTALVRAYGTRQERWPEAHHALFARHAATPAGQRLLRDEARIDRMLESVPVSDSLSPGFAARIHAISRRADALAPPWGGRFLRVAAFSCAACLIAGLAVGLRLGDRVLPGTAADEAVSALVFGAANWQGEVRDAFLSR